MSTLPSVDAQYLLKYIDISERFLNANVSLRDANGEVTKLNEEYGDKVSKGALKTEIDSGPVYMWDRSDCDSDEEWENRDTYEADGWMPSSIC